MLNKILEPINVNAKRLEAERRADADVLRSLHENGDCPAIVRPIDLFFAGSKLAISELEQFTGELGFVSKRTVELDNGTFGIEFVTESNTTPVAIDNLTVIALTIEGRFNVVYDGWGTVAMNN